MEWLNYHHLLYFYVVAKTGSIAAAGEQLELAQPTLSVQIKRLEKRLGEKLFNRVGRGLQLTEAGRMVFQYAEEIYNLGQEMMHTVKGRPQDRPLKVVIGVVDVLPKLIVHRLIEPVFRMEQQVQVICPEGRPDQLLTDMLHFRADLVLSDAPMSPVAGPKIFNHLLGECPVSIFAVPKLARTYRHGFPSSLSGAPWLLPMGNTTLRRSLDQWMDIHDIMPVIRGEFSDSALLKVVAQSGEGVFALPSVLEEDLKQHYGFEVLGRVDTIRERFYAISAERRIKHPAVRLISEVARAELFSK